METSVNILIAHHLRVRMEPRSGVDSSHAQDGMDSENGSENTVTWDPLIHHCHPRGKWRPSTTNFLLLNTNLRLLQDSARAEYHGEQPLRYTNTP